MKEQKIREETVTLELVEGEKTQVSTGFHGYNTICEKYLV